MVNKAYDIQTKDSAYQKKLEEKYQVKITKTDDKFYEDSMSWYVQVHLFLVGVCLLAETKKQETEKAKITREKRE